MAHRAAHRLGGHPLPAVSPGDLFRDPAVGHRLSEGDLQHDLPDLHPKGRHVLRQGRQESRILSGEVDVQPPDSLCKGWQILFFTVPAQALSEIFLTVKPEPCESPAVTAQGHGTQGRIVVIDVIHTAPLPAAGPFPYSRTFFTVFLPTDAFTPATFFTAITL